MQVCCVMTGRSPRCSWQLDNWNSAPFSGSNWEPKCACSACLSEANIPRIAKLMLRESICGFGGPFVSTTVPHRKD